VLNPVIRQFTNIISRSWLDMSSEEETD